MITKERAIEAIQEKIKEIDGVEFFDQFYPWQMATIGTLKRVVPSNFTIIEHISKIDSRGYYGGDMTKSAKRDSKQILESLLKDIERFGLEEPLKEPRRKEMVKVEVSQTNNQTQSTNVTISISLLIDVLKGELRTSEIQELKEILKSDQEPKVKQKSFIDKINSFGSGLASNILANLLTNPQVYNQLGRMI